MRHVQLHLADLSIGPRDLPLRYATITVVQRENSDVPDWEIVAHTVQVEPIAAATHTLSMTAIVGADDEGRLNYAAYEGTAAMVRRVDLAIVLRGVGTLAGFDERLLDEAARDGGELSD